MRKLTRYSMAYGGQATELIEGDIFRMIIRIPESGDRIITPPVTPPVAPPVTPPVAHLEKEQAGEQTTPEIIRLLLSLKGNMSRSDLQNALDLKDKKNFLELYLRPALESELIAMTIPDKPNSRKQSYQLTSKGQKVLKTALKGVKRD